MITKISVQDINELKFLAQQNDPSFMLKFYEHFAPFVTRLHEIAASKLNGAEMQICAYTMLHFSTKDIAMHLKCSVRSVENKKYRIRKKLGISSEMDFTLWIGCISSSIRLQAEAAHQTALPGA